MCNLTTANAALVNTNTRLANKLDQVLAQISNMQTEIDALKNQKGAPMRTAAKPKYYYFSHSCMNSKNNTSLNCFNKSTSYED